MCEEFPQFKAFIRACEFQEACHGLDVRACLIQPVQRVPRYRLLLIELLKYTHGNDPEWESLNASLQKVGMAQKTKNDVVNYEIDDCKGLNRFDATCTRSSNRLFNVV